MHCKNEAFDLAFVGRDTDRMLNRSDDHCCVGYCKHDLTTETIVLPMQVLVYYITYTIPYQFLLP